MKKKVIALLLILLSLQANGTVRNMHCDIYPSLNEEDGVYATYTGIKKFVQNELVYPKAALDEGREGIVRVIYTISKEGRVIDAFVHNPSGDSLLEAEALRVVKKLHFHSPAYYYGGDPVDFTSIVSVVFALHSSTLLPTINERMPDRRYITKRHSQTKERMDVIIKSDTANVGVRGESQKEFAPTDTLRFHVAGDYLFSGKRYTIIKKGRRYYLAPKKEEEGVQELRLVR